MDKISGSMEDLMNTPERAILAKYPIRRIAYHAYAAAILLAIVIDWHLLPNVLWFGLAGWLYTKPIGAVRLKDLPGLKSPYVAATWAYSFAGMVGAGYSLIFLIILINTVLFDVRDLIGDRVAGVRTIPVIFGLSRTVAGLMLLNIVLAFIHPISALIGGCLLWYFRMPRPNLKYDLWIDGWPILSLILTYVLSIAFIYFVVPT
jgi:4-hydroxybenzoate polyprenyltransferase